MKFLRMLSQDVYQNFTYTCINSAAWYSLKSFNYESAIKLMGHNEQEFSNESLQPNILMDGCKVNLNPYKIRESLFSLSFYLVLVSQVKEQNGIRD